MCRKRWLCRSFHIPTWQSPEPSDLDTVCPHYFWSTIHLRSGRRGQKSHADQRIGSGCPAKRGGIS